MMAWIWIFASVVALVYILQNLFSNPKKLPPGPPGIPILGHFHLLGKLPHQDLYKLARKYGPIMHMRLGMVPTIIVSSPAAAELFLKTHDLNFASRPRCEVAKHMAHDHRNLGFAAYGPYWRDMRKLCILELLSHFKINQFRPLRQREMGLLVETIKQAATKHQLVNVSTSVLGLTRDVICQMVFGKKFADNDINGEIGFQATALETQELAGVFNAGDYFPFLAGLDLQGLTRRMNEITKAYEKFMDGVIDEHVRVGLKKDTQDFVDTLMEILEDGNAGFEFDRRHVKAVILDLLLAGMDTSARTVDYAIAELIRHPEKMKKLQAELKDKIGMDHIVEESHLDKLEYLDLVVKETFRLHPVAPLLIPHESREDCTVNGFHIPKKSRVLINMYAIGRDLETWSNPETFCPERFIGKDIDYRGHNFELIPFGSGRRSCPGMALGVNMVKYALAQFVHCFDWEPADGRLPAELDMTEQFGLAMGRAKHIMAYPTYRLTKSAKVGN